MKGEGGITVIMGNSPKVLLEHRFGNMVAGRNNNEHL